jgi:hypothetical protein
VTEGAVSDGEWAYMALILTGFFSFAIVLFVLSRGFRDTTQARPASPPGELPKGSAKAAA